MAATQLVLALVLATAVTVLSADEDKPAGPAMVLYCNATGACIPCGPASRHDVHCSPSGYKQEVTCTAAAADAAAPNKYDFKKAQEQRPVVPGALVQDYASCASPPHWSVLQFEMAMAALLAVAMAGIRWRQRR